MICRITWSKHMKRPSVTRITTDFVPGDRVRLRPSGAVGEVVRVNIQSWGINYTVRCDDGCIVDAVSGQMRVEV
jgi:hypothetical protein